jgi:hypothetical protein
MESTSQDAALLALYVMQRSDKLEKPTSGHNFAAYQRTAVETFEWKIESLDVAFERLANVI